MGKPVQLVRAPSVEATTSPVGQVAIHRHAGRRARRGRDIGRLRRRSAGLAAIVASTAGFARNPTCSGVSCRFTRPAGAPKNAEASNGVSPKLPWPMRGESGFVAACDFVGEEVVRLVFLDRTAESDAGLHARIRGIGNGAERIHRLEVAIAKVSENVAVKLVRSGAGDDVDHAAGSASVFGGVVVGDDLKFLHRFLRNRGAHAVDGVVGSVGAIDVDQIRARPLSAHVEAGGRSGAGVGRVVANDLRIGEGEVDVIAAVDRQIIDAALADRVGGRTARGFDEFGLRRDFDDLRGRPRSKA